ncbi:MAG TPA: LytTR family DNA-binding domain-containing protein [Chitinophagaceae bacterium]|nr:LytTR family DNA-binding domain-containing protein [Chitinophagaceae bacterium]
MAENAIYAESEGKLIPIKHTDICVCEAARHKSIVHTSLRKSYLYPRTLKYLEEMLCGKTFKRIHDKYIINIDYVEEVLRYKTREYRMRNGMLIRASKRMNFIFKPK